MAVTAALAAAARKANVAKTTFEKVAAGGSFGRAVTMTPAQVKQVGTRILTVAKTNPDRAGALLQRMMDLNGEGKLKIKMPASAPKHAAGNVVIEMSNDVRAKILKIDPNANVPAHTALLRDSQFTGMRTGTQFTGMRTGGPATGVRPR